MTYLFLLICNLFTSIAISFVFDPENTIAKKLNNGIAVGIVFTASPVAGHLTYVYLGGL